MNLDNILINFRKNINDAPNLLKNHVIDSTGLLITATPINALLEVFVYDMSVKTSLNTRIYGAELTYLGMGICYDTGREFMRNKLKITDTTSEKIQTLADSIYSAGFSSIVSYPLYLLSGASEEAAIKGTVGAAVVSLFAGSIIGYGLDTFKDFTGIQKTKRLPKLLQNTSKNMKKILAAGLIVSSLAITAGAYEIKENYYNDIKKNISTVINYF